MILVILGICILLIIGGVWLYNLNYHCEPYGSLAVVIGILVGVTALLVSIFLTVDVASYGGLEKEIAMYQEENALIEARLEETVKAYQQYETDIFKDISNDNVMTYVTLFPELKSDTLVQKQIETYVSNNNRIKDLKSRLFYIDVEKWWLYFG